MSPFEIGHTPWNKGTIGDYWHKGQNPQDRIDCFTPFGYRTLVIWESELKNINNVEQLIVEFIRQREV